MLYKLDPADSFAELETRAYELEPADERLRIFVIKKNAKFFAYRNSCPHAGAPLNWQANKFLSFDQRYIQCALHGALFRIEDGYCIAGPCRGAALEFLSIEIQDGLLTVDL